MTEEVDNRSPKTVLQDKMLFYDEVARGILEKIVEALKADARPRGDLLAMMYKKMNECDKIAIECAEKLAPYKHAKLSSIEVKKDIVHRFVIRTPTVIENQDKWMKTIEHGAKAQGDATSKLLKSLDKKKKIEDAQIIDITE